MGIALLPELSTKCRTIPTGLGELCAEFPGAARLCATDVESGDIADIVKKFLGQVNAAMLPLQPFFSVLDCIKALFDCIQAIPDSILQLSPKPILDCIPNLSKAVSKLLSMLPPLSIPIMAKSILHSIIEGLRGLRIKLEALIRQSARILAAATRAAELGSFQLQLVADCAAGNLDAQLINVNNSMGGLNRLIGLINALLELAKLPCIPSLAGIAEVSEAVLAPLDAAIALLEGLEAAIPSLDLVMPALPPPGEC